MADSQYDPAEEVLREMEEQEAKSQRRCTHSGPQGGNTAVAHEKPVAVLMGSTSINGMALQVGNIAVAQEKPMGPVGESTTLAQERPVAVLAGNASINAMALQVAGSLPRRRLCGKQPAPPSYRNPQHDIGNAALASEAWTELVALSEDAQRQHVHYTHVPTENPQDRQPGSFSRKGFWEHLERVYREAYPEPANPTGSILLFGAVGQEETTMLHRHAPTYNSKRHYWNRVAKISYEKYRVKLNVVAHNGYYSMYTYITQASKKKQIQDLDQEVYLSKHHPRGKILKKLLEAGATASVALAGRKRKEVPENGIPVGKRIRSGDVYGLVANQGVRTVLDLQALACRSAGAGDTRLAEFCTATGIDKLSHLVEGAASVLEAPRALALQKATRMDLLRRAASEFVCTCKGIWIPGAKKVLENNNEDVPAFCRDVCRALEVGAKRGTNMAIIGEPGCGKSMLFEPFDDIFAVMGKPEAKSSFPLAGAIDAQVLLWQDWKHNDATVLFEDMLSLIVGERIDVRIPCQKNMSFRNTSPLFYTANSPLFVVRPNPQEMIRLNTAMAERFRSRVWQIPLPATERIADFPRCSKCCANFYLMYR